MKRLESVTSYTRYVGHTKMVVPWTLDQLARRNQFGSPWSVGMGAFVVHGGVEHCVYR